MGTVVDHPVHEVSVMILNTGARISALGFGSDTQGSVEDIKNAVIAAVKMGYRHFDTASTYGTEDAIGQGLAEAFKSGLVKREEVFVTSKIEDVDAADVVSTVKKSLGALQLEYLDLCLVHNPLRLRRVCTFPPKDELFLPSSMQGRWQALEQCMHDGLTKAIGVSNFSVKKLKDLLTYAEVIPAINQVELHPMWQQKQLVDFCRGVGIRVSAWHPLGGKPLSVPENAVIQDIADKHGRTPSQIALNWIIECGIIPIVRSYDAEKLSEYIRIFDFKISQEDQERIGSIEQKRLSLWDMPCTLTTAFDV